MNGLSLFSVALCFIALVIISPLSLYRSTTSRHHLAKLQTQLLDEVATKQTELIGSVLALEKRIVQASSDLDVLEKTLKESDDVEPGREDVLKTMVQGEIANVKKYLKVKIQELDAANARETQKVRDAWSDKANRFIVKWHGDDGVQTSKRMSSEAESLDFYQTVGDFAKKLLMFDGSNWIVIKEYGAEQWLSFIRNDGTPQNGDGKPTSKAKVKK